MTGAPVLSFALPGVDAPDSAAGFRVAPTGAIELVDGDPAVRQTVLLLLLTTPGERVMRPDYGCQLRQLAFFPNDQTTAGLAIHYVRRALDRWEPGIEVIHVDAMANESDPARLDVVLEYRVRVTRHVQRLVLGVALSPDVVR